MRNRNQTAQYCANRALGPGTSETSARLRSMWRARKWLRGVPPARLRVIEVAGLGVGLSRLPEADPQASHKVSRRVQSPRPHSSCGLAYSRQVRIGEIE